MAMLPAGTATGNEDAVRQGTVSQFFYLLGDVLKGTDSQPVMDASTRNTGVLGPAQTLGSVDVGVGANGEVYVRGQLGGPGNGQQTAQPAAAPAAIPPMLLLIGAAVAAYLLLK